MNMKRLFCLITTFSILLTLAGPPCLAQDDWRFHIIPFSWMIGINGNIEVKGSESTIDAEFNDIWDSFDRAHSQKVGTFQSIDVTC